MKTFAVFEAKNRFSELLAAVAHGEEITITRHGSPVARLVALDGVAPPSSPKQRQRVSGVPYSACVHWVVVPSWAARCSKQFRRDATDALCT